MPVPDELASALASLPEDPRFELIDGWTKHADGAWSFRFRARLSAEPTKDMPALTTWHLVVSCHPTDRIIRIYPDADDGITATFPHQDFNDAPVDGNPWRTGKPCLERPAFVFRRDGWSGEPLEMTDRLIWRIGRLLAWIDAAASDELLLPGDPFELPMQPNIDDKQVLGFRETADDLDWWVEPDQQWGFATIGLIPGANATGVIADFMDPRLRSIRRIPWSTAIPIEDQRIDAVWMIMPAYPVLKPWRTAATWAELTALCQSLEIDLPAILADAGARLRRIRRPKHSSPVHLLLGFPIQEIIGESDQRFHWLAVKNMTLCGRNDVRRGYSGKPEARRAWDIDVARSGKALEWRLTANWAPDQLRKRGGAEDEVRAKSVLVLGCGTLGAEVAENLLRMGVTRMALLDFDAIGIGNLSRHSLTMADAGRNKAVQLAKRLNLAAPDADVVPFSFSFPPSSQADIDKLKDWNVVIDCTASDAVLRGMASHPWATERTFVTLAMTWQANGLFAYSDTGSAFPAIDALERFAAASPPAEGEAVGEMEGIGCWHPVFPAKSDDVKLWGAIGSKFAQRAIVDRSKAASLYVQREDGSVDRSDA